MKRAILAGACLALVAASCAVDRDETNPVVSAENGTLDAHLRADVVYGVGIELAWDKPVIEDLQSFRIYKGAPDANCKDMLLLTTLDITETSYRDEQVVPETEYAYCLTASRGEEETARDGAPTAKQTPRAPSFVVNGGNYLAAQETISVDVSYHQDLFSPEKILVALNNGNPTEIPFAAHTSVDISGANGAREIALSLKDGSGRATKPQAFDIYLCKGPLTDNDGDGYPGGEPIADCPGLVFDCDDGDADINPGVAELCDGVDQDCDGVYDNGFDGDGDSYTTCGTRTTDGSSTTADCNDGSAAINPGIAELCDGVDQDCDGVYDNGFDGDGDSYTTCGTLTTDGSAVVADCDDGDPNINAAAGEVCDGIDNNCDGALDEGLDDDHDGYGKTGTENCPNPGVDCDDGNPLVHPDAVETCEIGPAVDDNCDGDLICDGGGVDADGDGYGSLASGGSDNCDGDVYNWTSNGCANCVDGDGDGFGADCDYGLDCDDTDVGVNEQDYVFCQSVTSPDYWYDVCYEGVCISPGACGDASCNVRYAHFVVPPASGHSDFTRTEPVAGQPVVTDNVTGLVWQGSDAGTHTWQDALTYCDGLDWGGYTDWYLPDEYELQSIVDYGRMNPSIDPVAFPGTPSNWFWTSSSYAGDSSYAWYVYFNNGSVDSVD